MRLPLLAALAALASSACANSHKPLSHAAHDYYAVHLQPNISPEAFAAHLGLELHGQLGILRDHYLFRHLKHDHDIVKDAVRAHRRRKRDIGYQNDLLDGVLLHEKQELKPPKVKRPALSPLQIAPEDSGLQVRQKPPPTDPLHTKGIEIAKTLGIEDPIYNEQWHLYNAVQQGHDLNVTGVWLQGITGKNATVCIVDDGLDMDSKDLKDNYFAKGSYDFNEGVDEPRPRLDDDRHGTRCAGEVAAVKNDVCGVGVAYDARIAGIRILSKPITDADEALAMTYGLQDNDIYSCSWGPTDDGREMGQPGILIKRSMLTAVQEGRGGKGTIYVFAAGNGAAADDNCNFDGYTNSIYSITVGAIDRKGQHPYYSEKCSAQLVVTYSSGSGDAIHTTDVGTETCVATHGGTSAAGPLAAGIYALALEVRPELTWRDMQWLTVETAVKLDHESDWQKTALGKEYSHQFGYGKLDAWALVELAKTWKLVKPQAWHFSPWQHVRHPIPEGDVGVAATYTVTQDMLDSANLAQLEHVTVTMNIEHTRRGDLSVELRSPSGIVSHLSTARKRDDFVGGYNDWTFSSVAHWGESGIGDWTIVVKDLVDNPHSGTFVDWRLNLFGECIDAEKQQLLPLPNEHDDDDHDREDVIASTASITVPTSTAELVDNPTDHPDRPVNQRPSDAKEQPAEPTRTASFEAPVEASPVASSTAAAATATESSKSDSFLPSPFPTFGVSKRRQVWIYGSLALIVIFCGSIGTYLYLAKRRRQRQQARDNYEFDRLDDFDDDDDVVGRPGRRGKRRAGELYDAFAGESDEELFSGDEDAEEHESYRDEGQETLDEKQTRSSEGD